MNASQRRVQAQETARLRAQVLAVLIAVLAERPITIALDRAMRKAEELGLEMVPKDWVAIIKALGVESLEDFMCMIGNVSVTASERYFGTFLTQMGRSDWD